jgi:hypothetical protein
MSDRHTFTTLEAGWQMYLKAYGDEINQDEIDKHRRSYMTGATCYDSIMFRSVEQLGPEASKYVIKAMHEEIQEHAMKRLIELDEAIAKRRMTNRN